MIGVHVCACVLCGDGTAEDTEQFISRCGDSATGEDITVSDIHAGIDEMLGKEVGITTDGYIIYGSVQSTDRLNYKVFSILCKGVNILKSHEVYFW